MFTHRMVKRVARELSERLGNGAVTAHHGSMARDQRLSAEQRLKHGELKALVATASLELGIDIGQLVEEERALSVEAVEQYLSTWARGLGGSGASCSSAVNTRSTAADGGDRVARLVSIAQALPCALELSRSQAG